MTFKNRLLENANNRMLSMWHKVSKLTDFAKDLDTLGGFYQTGWCGRIECENRLKEYKATIRCMLKVKTQEFCFNCDKESATDILIARAY